MERAWEDWQTDREACIRRNRQTAEREFNPANTGLALKELFTEILANKAPPGGRLVHNQVG
jgi:hypothetical protein